MRRRPNTNVAAERERDALRRERDQLQRERLAARRRVMLFHVSEESGIERFEPRTPQNQTAADTSRRLAERQGR
jgi:hypothetical protein